MSANEYISTPAIVLRRVPYRDTRTIVTLLTRETGVVAVTVAIGKSAASRRRNALLMPGSRVEVVIRRSVGQSVYTLVDVGVADMAASFMSVPAQSIAMFVCEVTASLLREASSDLALFEFVDATVKLLSQPGVSTSGIANLPVAFLIGMMAFIGIEPDSGQYAQGMVLDVTGGVFRSTPPLTGKWLNKEESRIAALLLRINYRNMSCYRFNRSQRSIILDHLLQYYTLHFTPLTNLRTLPVLHSLFE